MDRRYRPDTLVLEAEFETAEGAVASSTACRPGTRRRPREVGLGRTPASAWRRVPTPSPGGNRRHATRVLGCDGDWSESGQALQELSPVMRIVQVLLSRHHRPGSDVP